MKRIGRSFIAAVVAILGLVTVTGRASALDLPETRSWLNWVESSFSATTLGETLGASPSSERQQLTFSPAAVQVHFLVNQCSIDMEPPFDLFSNPSRIADAMGVGQSSNIGQVAELTAPGRQIPVPLPRPAVPPASPPILTQPDSPVLQEQQQVAMIAPIPRSRPDWSVDQPRNLPETQVHTAGSFTIITIELPSRVAPPNRNAVPDAATSQLSPSITFLR